MSTSPSVTTLALQPDTSLYNEKKLDLEGGRGSAAQTVVGTPSGSAGPSRSPSPSRRKEGKNTGHVQVQPARNLNINDMSEAERSDYLSAQVEEGEKKYHKLGWVQLVVVLIVEAIALGSLSLPKAFATLGMVAGTILTVGIGLIAIYTSYVIGQVKLKFPGVQHYDDVAPLLLGKGRAGRWLQHLLGGAFVVYLILLVGSHCLTGTIAFKVITKADVCTIVWGIVSMVILFVCALPPSFAEMAVLGYIDFVSIIAAILITLIATGVRANNAEGGFSAVDWSALPAEGATFADAMIAVTNIVFAYSFAICQFSFMEEMHTPKDYEKSIWVLGITEIVIYTCTGALGYAFIGKSAQSPALLSAGDLVSKIAFGIALPVIFISGSINTVTAGRFLLDRVWPHSTVRYVSDRRGWALWITMITIGSVIAWIVAEAIPFFSDLLAIVSALFISGFSFYIPGFMWFFLIRDGPCLKGWKNISLTVLNLVCIAVGLICLGCGTYAAVWDIKLSFDNGTVGSPFTCN